MVKKLGLLAILWLLPTLAFAQGGGQFGGSAGGSSGATGTVSGQSANSIPVGSGATALTSVVCTPPAVNGVYPVEYSVTASSAVAPTCPESGLTSRVVSGASDTILFSDNQFKIQYTGTAATAVTLPTPTTLTNANFVTQLENRGTATVTVTPTTNTISLNGAVASASAAVLPGQQCALTVDGTSATQWDLNCTALFSLAYTPAIVPDEKRAFDGSVVAILTGSGDTTTGTAPAYTTTVNNDVVLAIFELSTGNWSVAPATGTNLVQTNVNGGQYGQTVQYQTKATAGSVAAVTGTFAANQWWNSTTVALESNGSAITFGTANTTQQASGATLTLTVPTNSNGQFIIACVEFFRGAISAHTLNNIIPPSQFTYRLAGISDTNGANVSSMECFGKFASSEPASYVWTQTQNTGMTGWIAVASNVAAATPIDNAPTLTSASANFLTTDVGKDICIGGTLIQSCGTISSRTSSTVVVCNTCFSSGGSSLAYVYGTDNSVAIQAAMNAAQAGTLYLPRGGMMFNTALTFPAAQSLNIRGEGSSLPNWGFRSGGNNINRTVISGSELTVASTSLPAAIVLSPTVTAGQTYADANIYSYDLADFSIVGGAGVNSDGCGGLGFQMLDVTWVTMTNVKISNCINNNLDLSVVSGSVADYVNMVQIQQSWFLLSGGSGMYVHNLGATSTVEKVNLFSDQFDDNFNAGLRVGGIIHVFNLIGNNIQRNLGPSYQLLFDAGASPQGCIISGNYFETDTGNAPIAFNYTSVNMEHCVFGQQFSSGSTIPSVVPLVLNSAVGATIQKSETTSADANVLTVIPVAVAGTYRICFTASVSAATSGVIGWTLSWKDSNANAQTNIAQSLFQQGTAAPALTFTTSAASNYQSCSSVDTDASSTAIVVKWVGGGTTTALVSATAEKLL